MRKAFKIAIQALDGAEIYIVIGAALISVFK